MSTFDKILESIPAGTRLRTPDDKVGKPFVVEKLDLEGVDVRTDKGGRVRISLFTFDTAIKYLTDHNCRGETWMPIKDEDLQMLLNAENDRVRASSYVLSILGAAGVIDVDGKRPNRVRLR
jgi:hypothetical protein